MRYLRIAVQLLISLVVAALTAGYIGRIIWQRSVRADFARLDSRAAREPASAGRDSSATVPPPVARYFAYAIPLHTPAIRRAEIVWSGEFLVRANDSWRPFSATEVFTVRPPGLVWSASIAWQSLLPIDVEDSYVDGSARMRGKVASIFSIVDERDTPELGTAALQRYLAECAWLPTALLPQSGVEWTPVDDSTARATLIDHEVRASAEFHFAASGEIQRVSALRYRSTPNGMVPARWVGTFNGYTRVHGMMVPGSAEVEWELPEGRSPYWRGRLDSAKYE